MSVVDVAIDTELGRCFVQVIDDTLACCYRIRFCPRIEAKAKGVQVGIGADAGVLEQAPRTTELGAAFEDGVGGGREVGLDAIAGIDCN
jgi:hypothetical protein